MYKVKNTNELCTYMFSLLLASGADYAIRWVHSQTAGSEKNVFCRLYIPISLSMISLRILNESIEFFDHLFLYCYERGCLPCFKTDDNLPVSESTLPLLSPNSNHTLFESASLSKMVCNLKRKAIYPASIAIAVCCEFFLIPKLIQNTQINLLVLSLFPAVLYLLLHKLLDLSEQCSQQIHQVFR